MWSMCRVAVTCGARTWYAGHLMCASLSANYYGQELKFFQGVENEIQLYLEVQRDYFKGVDKQRRQSQICLSSSWYLRDSRIKPDIFRDSQKNIYYNRDSRIKHIAIRQKKIKQHTIRNCSLKPDNTRARRLNWQRKSVLLWWRWTL